MLQIRRYRDADRDAVWLLHDEGLHATGAHIGDGPWDDDLRQIQAHYLDRTGEFLVGELDGGVVAMGALRPAEERIGEIKRMRVRPGFQRRGFGTEILLALEARARELGYTALKLDTTEQQVAARHFYERHGYRNSSKGTGHGFVIWFYEKQL
jgi:ribosomal protein S18 acetylase RimI-like enzyme